MCVTVREETRSENAKSRSESFFRTKFAGVCNGPSRLCEQGRGGKKKKLARPELPRKDFGSSRSRPFSLPNHKMPNSGARSSTPGRAHYEEAGSHLEYVAFPFSAILFLPRDRFLARLRSRTLSEEGGESGDGAGCAVRRLTIAFQRSGSNLRFARKRLQHVLRRRIRHGE